MSEHWRILTEPWEGPFGGVPPLDRVEVSMFEPALSFAIEEQLAELEAICANPEPPTFDNTLLAFERSGATLARVRSVYYIWSSNVSSEAFRAVAGKFAPKLAALRDRMYQDKRLLQRIEAVRDQGGLGEEEQRLIENEMKDFRRAGTALDEVTQARLREINAELSSLYESFAQNVLADEENCTIYLQAHQLSGLGAGFVASLAQAAEEDGKPGLYAVRNTRSSVEPFLASSTERELRERVWRNFFARANNGDGSDNNQNISDILRLRTERAKLLGFASHAEYRLFDAMAEGPVRAKRLMDRIWPAAVSKFRAELALMKAEHKEDDPIQPWDVRLYAERVRVRDHNIDPSLIAEHFQLENLREGMFWAASELWGWQFQQMDLPVPHPDVRVWAIQNADGTPRGLFYFDPFARKGKRSGAWMSAYRSQRKLDGDVLPIVSNNCNYAKGAQGQPTLLTWDQATTLFHEFGHAMHGLASDVTYASLAGTNVARDYVEFPSQLNEHWLSTRQVLTRFALHYKTGLPMTDDMLERLDAANKADSGFRTTEFLASALVDMVMHEHTQVLDDVQAFEAKTLAEIGCPDEIVMRHRSTHFLHLFSSEGYSAAYYSYLWADALTADAAEAFAETGFFHQETAQRYWGTVLSKGNTVEPAQGFKAFRGREPEVAPLLRARGLVEEGSPA